MSVPRLTVHTRPNGYGSYSNYIFKQKSRIVYRGIFDLENAIIFLNPLILFTITSWPYYYNTVYLQIYLLFI